MILIDGQPSIPTTWTLQNSQTWCARTCVQYLNNIFRKSLFLSFYGALTLISVATESFSVVKDEEEGNKVYKEKKNEREQKDSSREIY